MFNSKKKNDKKEDIIELLKNEKYQNQKFASTLKIDFSLLERNKVKKYKENNNLI